MGLVAISYINQAFFSKKKRKAYRKKLSAWNKWNNEIYR